MSPADLHRALAHVPPGPPEPDVLIGHDTFDDAGVYRISADLALVQTIDFFTPIVDDPYDYGQIAAANALSDVYAMGGTPKTALNLVCWPDVGPGPEVLGRILAGGTDKMHEARCAVIGGHSIRDDEMKFGYAVTGLVHPDRMLTNAAARPGDALVLTKPLGTGVLTTALKAGAATDLELAPAVASMKALSGPAMALALAAGVRSATDVTGFGLAGHGVQLADASGVRLAIDADALPLFARAEELARAGHLPGGAEANRAHFGPRVDVGPAVGEWRAALAFDPQTSGGLLLAVAPETADDLVAGLNEAGFPASARIGEVLARDPADGPALLLR